MQLTIAGSNIASISGFYKEINRVFMASENWVLGDSLDALSDMLCGDYGDAAGGGPVTVLWSDSAQSRIALGFDATREWLLAKLDAPGRFDSSVIRSQLDALQRGEGQSYFDIVQSIFAEYPRFRVVLG